MDPFGRPKAEDLSSMIDKIPMFMVNRKMDVKNEHDIRPNSKGAQCNSALNDNFSTIGRLGFCVQACVMIAILKFQRKLVNVNV
jgi:hypothetical protein